MNIPSKFLLAMAAMAVMTACSPKSSTENTSAQTQAIVDQAVAEAKKQIFADQAAEKAKQEAQAAEEAAAQAKQDEAIAQAVADTKKEMAAKQQASRRASQSAPAQTTSAKADTTTAPAIGAVAQPEVVAKKMVCTTCGTVLSVNEVEVDGKGSGLGVVAGGVVGGLLGNQVGNGTGRDLATIAGAIGGAVAGNKIEKNSRKTKSYDIKVKMETGEEMVFHQAIQPDIAKGDAVRIDNNVVIKNKM